MSIEQLAEGELTCLVTRYSINGREVVEATTSEKTTWRVEKHGGTIWLLLSNCSGSSPLVSLANAGDGDWCAQAGTKPVYIEPCSHGPRPCAADCGCGPDDDTGGWGGRNYPEIRVEEEELGRVMLLIANKMCRPGPMRPHYLAVFEQASWPTSIHDVIDVQTGEPRSPWK